MGLSFRLILFSVLLPIFILPGCKANRPLTPDSSPALNESSSPEGFNQKKAAMLRLWMHDKPNPAENITNIYVTILRVEVGNPDGEFFVLNEAEQEIDLLQLQNNASMILGERYLPIGMYDQIRLILSDQNRIMVDGGEHSLFIPSGEQTGIKLKGEFEALGGRITELVIDFDAEKSVHHAPGKGYMLKPVITLESVTTLGPGLVLTEEQMDAVGDWNDRTDGGNIHWGDTEGGAFPSMVTGSVSYPGTGGGENTARAYFDEFKNLYGLANPAEELKTIYVRQDEQGAAQIL